MVSINPKLIFAVSKKEFLDNIRNRWIIALTIMFILFIIIFSVAMGAQQEDAAFGGMEDTVMGLLSFNSFLIPIIAIMLGALSIVSEVESGSLLVALSYPINRTEVLIGKFFGLGSVLVFTIFLGYGIGGLIIAATSGTDSGLEYVGFIFLTILLGFIFLSVSIFISAFCKRRITAIGLGIFFFFWGMIYGTIIIAVVFATMDITPEQLMTGQVTFPEWMFITTFGSPVDLHQISVTETFGISEYQGISTATPEWMSLGLMLLATLLWIAIPLLLAYRSFKKRDI